MLKLNVSEDMGSDAACEECKRLSSPRRPSLVLRALSAGAFLAAHLECEYISPFSLSLIVKNAEVIHWWQGLQAVYKGRQLQRVHIPAASSHSG
jgi:hypothetical protein